VAESDQLALDSPVTPAGVVLGHADDERLGRCRGRPSTRLAPVTVIPLAGHQASVPGKQRRRSEGEDLRPAATGHPVRQGGQLDPVRRRVAHPVDLPAQDRVLVPQHQQLRVLGHLPATDHCECSKQGTGQLVQQGQQHPVMISARCSTPAEAPGQSHESYFRAGQVRCLERLGQRPLLISLGSDPRPWRCR
jgi:hypothetical protein